MTDAAVLAEWSDAPFSHAPIAPATGPFPHRPFLETWWRHVGGDDRLAVIASDSGTLPLRVSQGSVMFCGDADLTDYHSPLGDPQPPIAGAAERFSAHPYDFDSLPEEAAARLTAALEAEGQSPRTTEEAVTAVIDLPGTIEEWLERLGKKQRHEVRRKQRRFATMLGEPRLERRTDDDAITTFAELHRGADGAKGGFMTPQREAFFADLVERVGAVVDVLVTEDGPVAAAFGFPEPDGYYLYNSAFSREAAPASPGIVLLATLIEELIAGGVPRLDLLKGDEVYKFRLGATRRPLYRIAGTFT